MSISIHIRELLLGSVVSDSYLQRHFSWLHPWAHSINHSYMRELERVSSARLTHFVAWQFFFMTPVQCLKKKKKKKRSAASLLTDSPLIPFIPTCEWLRGSCSRGHFPTADLNGCDGRNHTLPKEIRGTVNAWQCRPSPQLCHQTTSVNSKAEIGDVTLMRLNSPDPHGWLLFWSGHIFEPVAHIFSRWLRTKEHSAPTALCTWSRNHEGPFKILKNMKNVSLIVILIGINRYNDLHIFYLRVLFFTLAQP